jgi:hypothetical protein
MNGPLSDWHGFDAHDTSTYPKVNAPCRSDMLTAALPRAIPFDYFPSLKTPHESPIIGWRYIKAYSSKGNLRRGQRVGCGAFQSLQALDSAKTRPRRYMARTFPVCSVLTAHIIGGMVAGDHCAQLQQLKRQYEAALRTWGEYQFLRHNEPIGTQARRSEQLYLKQKALDARNEANDRLLGHKETCPLCTGKAG